MMNEKPRPDWVPVLDLGDLSSGRAQTKPSSSHLAAHRSPYEVEGEDENAENLDLYLGFTHRERQNPSNKKLDKEEVEEQKRRYKVIETVMIDQLSRAVVCEEGQDQRPVPKKAHVPGQKRGQVRHLHHTQVKTESSGTEKLLSQCVTFGVTVCSMHGRDCLRYLLGFFFPQDETLTVYEYRRFGKSHKALPFIKRGRYVRLGRAAGGGPIGLRNICPGKRITMMTEGQPLPASLMTHDVIHLKVTEVDNKAKSAVVLKGVPASDCPEVWEIYHRPTECENSAMQLASSVQEIIQKQIKKRSIKVLLGLGKIFFAIENRQELPNITDYDRALIEFRVKVPQEKFEDLWEVIDVSGSSFLPSDYFFDAYFGRMNCFRNSLVRKAFLKVDANLQGNVPVSSLRKFFNAELHPKVVAGVMSVEELWSECSQSLLSGPVLPDDCIPFAGFLLFYEGISIGIEQDKEFELMMRNIWRI